MVNEATGCREWQRAKRGGYGRLWDGERVVDTHRLSHEVFIGLIPAGLDVLHDCDNPCCIEPGHLKAGTPKQNTADMVAKGRHLAGRAICSAKFKGRASKSRGEKHPKAKLTAVQVLEIKPLLNVRRVNVSALARQYGVSESLLRNIRSGRNWSWL